MGTETGIVLAVIAGTLVMVLLVMAIVVFVVLLGFRWGGGKSNNRAFLVSQYYWVPNPMKTHQTLA